MLTNLGMVHTLRLSPDNNNVRSIRLTSNALGFCAAHHLQLLSNDQMLPDGAVTEAGGVGTDGGTSPTIALHMTILTPARKSVR